MASVLSFFRGNRKLRPEGLEIEYTQDQIDEILRCEKDIEYFIDKYVYTIHPDEGLIKMDLRDYQRELIELFGKERFIIARWGRQMGKTAAVAAIICHYILFNPGKTVAILGNKAANAREVLRRVKIAYENLPIWLQRGVVNWNKGSIEIEGGKSIDGEDRKTNTRVIASATSSDGIRGESISLLYIDEVAHIRTAIWEEFYDAVYPTVSAGKTTKILLTSTPKGMNHFYNFSMKARRGESTYVEHVARWNRAPGRDGNWEKDERLNMGDQKFAQEHEVAFIGSSLTLISPSVLEKLEDVNPISAEPHLTVIEEPLPNHVYVISVDSSRGTSNDYSVATVFDTTSFPIRDVAMFRCNKTSSVEFPGEIVNLGDWYNEAYLIVELNDAGEEVANSLSFDYGYENILGYDAKSDRTSEKSHDLGLWVTKRTKLLGCDRFKILVNNGYFKPQHEKFITELWHFVENGRGTYEAEGGWHDDIVMTAVNFCYFFFSRSNLHKMFEGDESLAKIINIGQLKQSQSIMTSLATFGGRRNAALEADIQLIKEKNMRRLGINSTQYKGDKAAEMMGFQVGRVSDMTPDERRAFLK